MKDLANLQVFLITTREDQNEIKSEYFEFDWKSFFISNAKLKPIQKNYYYKNQVLEKDAIEWNKKVIWYGRRSKKCKFDVEGLQEQKQERDMWRNDLLIRT